MLTLLPLAAPSAASSSAAARPAAQAAPVRPGETTVSLTFDDAQATQYMTRDLLAARGMRATYYVPSALVGSSPYYMDWAQLEALRRDGNELGGHTRQHVDLRKLAPAQVRQQVCEDRDALRVRFPELASFAYPYAASTPAVERVVRQCGYATGRTAGNIRAPRECPVCPPAESVPPRNPYFVRTAGPATRSTTLAEMQQQVLGAEASGGGWVILVFHGLCTGRDCTSLNDVPLSLLTALLDWLQPREARGTSVRTVGEAFGAAPLPSPQEAAPCRGRT